jgi:restriction endonuclease S subunit
MELNELPENWCLKPLGEVASISAGTTAPQGTEYFDGGNLPFVRAQDVGRYGRTTNLTETTDKVNQHAVAEKRLRLARRGAVLFPKSGASILTNSRAKLGVDAYVVSHLAIVEANNRILCDDFLFHWLCTLDMADIAQSEAGYPSVRLSDVANLQIPVPPLAEQRRIVARVEALTRRLDQARQARQAALVETITCLRSVIAGFFASCDESSFRSLGEVTGIIGGNSIPENAPHPCKGEERIGLMKVSDMNAPGNERFITSCKLETSRAAAVARKLRIVPVGAVVFPKRGGAIATNKKRVLTIPAALDPNTMGVFPLPESKLTSDFLFWWFESLDLAELQEDGGIPQINKKHLDPLQIPVIPEPEQRAIVARLDAMRGKLDELQRLQREVAAELASFTPALLAKAFRGEL